MTLSLQHSPAPWDRTLPKPTALLTNGPSEAYPHRSSSLLQHHLVDGRLLHDADNYGENHGRRSTVACMPVIQSPVQAEHQANNNGAVGNNSCIREGFLEVHTASNMSIGATSRSSSPTSTSPGIEAANQFCLCQREPKIPRPRNAFILYRQHHHAAAVAQNPGLPNPDISKIIGEQWRQLPEKVKEEWKALAEDEKTRHSQQYPDYRYKPKRSGRLNQQSSVSGPSSASSDIPPTCQKCGGKPVNAPHMPHTPHTPHTIYPPITPAVAVMPQMNARMSTSQQLISPPHSARMRQYTDAYGRPVAPVHDPRFQYASVQPRIAPTMDGPESKKRRFNGEAVYAPSRQVYQEPGYQQSPHERAISEAMATGQFHRSNIPPARTGYPMQMPATRPSHAPQQQPQPQTPQHRRDISLTLPPLKTPLSQQVPASLTAGPNSPKSGVEAMIMTIPVLNKVKILSQIAPLLAAPGPASPPRGVRGAIIAVEGMDPNSVFNMTNTLAEQLERDGTFAVRIFGGPDPYSVLASSNRASNGDGEQLSVSGFLDLISQWHKISKEMQNYITQKPSMGAATPEDVVMGDTIGVSRPEFSSNLANYEAAPSPRTPISAISPKTMTQASELSIVSPDPASNPQRQPADESSPIKTAQPKSRIPASAIAQAEAEVRRAQSDTSMPRSESSSSLTPRPSTTQQPQPAPQSHPQPQPTTPTTRQSTSIQSYTTNVTRNHGDRHSGSAIPIALVPHYQLTTVDASSIAMPITDAYSPHSHWQWLATLWRGCVGPDVTVIIQAGDNVDDLDQSQPPPSQSLAPSTSSRIPSHAHTLNHTYTALTNAAGTAQPSQRQPSTVQAPLQPPSQPIAQQQQQSQQQDVEVRLMDCRAVVVRAKGRGDTEGCEWWDKAKRRVGFEVEEFLRR